MPKPYHQKLFWKTLGMMKQFKCVVPYLPPQFQYHSKHGYDTVADPVCINKTSNEMETIMRFYDHYSSNGQRNFCQMPCTTMEVWNHSTYILVVVGLSGILKVKQKLGVTFNFNKQDIIDFTKFSKMTMCRASEANSEK